MHMMCCTSCPGIDFTDFVLIVPLHVKTLKLPSLFPADIDVSALSSGLSLTLCGFLCGFFI